MKIRVLIFAFMLAPCLHAADWPEYKSPDGKFAISMPGKVTVKSGQNRYPFGVVKITAHSHTPNKDTVWRVATHDYPEAFLKTTPPGKLLDLMAKGMAKNVKGKPAIPKAIKLGEHEGREFKLTAAPPGDYSVHTRLYVVGTRVYQLTLVAKANDIAFKSAEKFFDSFKLKK